VSFLDRWRDTEPLRLYLYGITVPVLGVAVVYGWVTTEQLGAWLAVAAALFIGSSLAGELARRQVSSPATVHNWLNQAHRDSYSRGVHDAEDRAPDQPATEATPVQHPPTTALRAQSPRRGTCGYIESGRRCVLDRHGRETPHHYG
jgi:hypothetical protein